jgi:hypothetical protein
VVVSNVKSLELNRHNSEHATADDRGPDVLELGNRMLVRVVGCWNANAATREHENLKPHVVERGRAERDAVRAGSRSWTELCPWLCRSEKCRDVSDT